MDVAEVESRLETGPKGLSADEAGRRAVQYGPNQLEEAPPPGIFETLLHQFQSPLIYILLIAAAVTLALQDYIDSAVIAAVLILNAVIGFVQERQAEKAVRALMGLVSPKAQVMRDGRRREIESRDLVPGDLILLESGARVPADIRLAAATAFSADESLLTGESTSVGKRTEPVPEKTLAADRKNMVFTGSVVSAGRARGYVVAIGKETVLGQIAEQVRTEEEGQTPLQERMNRFAHVVGLAVLISAAAAFALGLSMGQTVVDMIKVAVALGVAAVPEGLPVVFTITLALGVHRMARRNAVIRRLPAVETLGSTTVIGSDKTGTLTENRMTVQEVFAGGRSHSLSGDGEEPLPIEDEGLRLALLTVVLTNEAQLSIKNGQAETQGDPTEVALLAAARRFGVEPEEARERYEVLSEIPFEPELKYSASFRQSDGRRLAFVKGAPEKILAMSTRLHSGDREEELDEDAVLEAAKDMAARGLRVLAAAYRELDGSEDPEEEPRDLVFLGLFGMMDPPREGVKGAIDGCKKAGIRVLMITGDHAQTASSIGRKLGIGDDDSTVLTGDRIEEMTDRELQGRVGETDIFARVSPDHKYRIVRALRSQQEVVAVTGDGVNDAPALKAADIGIAMGKSGTDVAREASDMVLTDDNFVSIYAAVEEGRVTFDNVRKVTFFLISTGAAAIVTILTALVMQWPIPFLPAQLLWMNLVTNGLQDVALAFEPGEPDVIRRRPRRKDEGIISPLLWERTALSGVVIAAGTLLLFTWELNDSGSLTRAQTVALTTMVIFQAFQVGNARSSLRSVFAISPFSNPFLFAATAAALLIHAGALYFGPTQLILRVEPIEWEVWTRILGVGLSIVAAVEAHKAFRRKFPMKRGSI
jgi:calcium-translocating P-type ATPase